MSPALSTQDFDGLVSPAELQLFVVTNLLGGAPFSRSLDPLPTSSGRVAWPVVDPEGGGWVAEGQPLPEVAVGPDAYVSVVKKLAGVFDLTTEMDEDSRFPLAQSVAQVVADTLGPELDDGVINGGPDAPSGVWDIATATPDNELWQGVFAAIGELGDVGGSPTHVAVRPSVLAAEAARTDSANRPLWASGLVVAGGVTFVGCPALRADQALIYDANAVRLIVRQDFRFERDTSVGFRNDTVAMRVKGRFAVGLPTPGKSIRKLTITAAAPAVAAARAGK